MLRSLAVLLIAAVPAGAAPACVVSDRTVDLSCTFDDPPTRDQGAIGDCHAFASVGVLESALMRATGERIELSEADMWVMSNIGHDKVFAPGAGVAGSVDTVPIHEGPSLKKMLAEDDLRRVLERKDKLDVWVEEGAWIDFDVANALNEGLARRATISYDVFTRTWLGSDRAMTPWGVKTQTANLSRRIAADVVSYNNSTSLTRLELPTEIPADVLKAAPAIPPTKEELALRLLAEGDPNRMRLIRLERSEMRRIFSMFKLLAKNWDLPQDLDTDSCLASGVPKRAWIIENLRAGRPVAIGMSLQGMEEWGGDGAHAIVLTGYATKGSHKVFSVRNSWGGINPDIPDDQLCRVMQAVTVETPDDPGWVASLRR